MTCNRPIPDCRHWVDVGLPYGGACSINRHGSTPSFGVCRRCLADGGDKTKGLGDVIAKTIDVTIGAKRHVQLQQYLGRRSKSGKCGCGEKQDELNKAFPFGQKGKQSNAE